MASEELRNAIDTFDYRQYLRYKGLSDDEIPETLSDEKKQALFRRAHEDAYEDMVKAYKADPFTDADAAKDKAREDLLKGRDYLRPLFGLWEKQQTADEIYKPEVVLGEALRQSGVDITDPNFSIESLPDSIRYKELTPYIEQYANTIINDNLKYNAPELAGTNKKTFIENFRNINGLSSLDTINDLFAQIAKRNAEQAREERVVRGEIERGWVDKVFGTDGWINAALGVGTAGGAGMLGNSAVIAGNQGQRALEWAEENPLHVAFGPLAWAASKVPGLSSVVEAGNEWLSQYTKGDVNYLRPDANSWARRKLMEFERWGMRMTNEAARVRDSMNYMPKFDRFLEDYAKDWDFGGFTGRILEQAASNWPSVAQNLVVPALGAGVGAMLAGPLGAGAGALWGYGLTTGGSLLVGAPMSAGDALADLADHGVYDTFEQEKYLPYVTAAVTLDYISTLALHTGFSGFVGRGVNAGIGSLFTSRAEREAAKKALQQAAAAQGMNWNTIQSVAGKQLLKVRAAELAGASTRLGKAMGKVAGPLSSFLEEMYTETAQEDIAMQLLNYATSQASQGQGAWESLGEMGKKFLEGGVNPRNWSPVPFWGRESMFAQYEDGAKYSPRMYNERLLSAGLVGGLMGGGTHIGMNTFQAVSDKLNGRNRKQDASVIATDEKGNTALMLARNTERSLAEKMFATMQAKGLGVNAQTVVGVDLQNVGGAYTANFNGVTGVGEDATKAFMDLSYRANLNRQNIDSNTITENNGGWEATLANNEKLRVVGTNAEQILRDIVNIHNSDNHPLVINRGATIEYNPNNVKPWKIKQSNGITVRAETLYDNYALYDFSTNASGNLIVDSVIRRKGKQDVEHSIGLNLTQTGDITFTDQFQNIQNAVANSNGRLVLLDATESKRGTRNPRVRVNGSVTNNTMRILDVESGVIYTVKLSKGRRNSNAHVNVTATTLDGRKLRLDANVAKQTLRSAANPNALNNNIRLATPSTGITIQGETLAGQTGYHFNAAQIAEITKRTGAQIMAQTTNHLELSLPTWIDGRETMTSLTLDIDDAGKVWASANGQTIEIEGINDRYVGDFANETAGRILAETADSLQIHALTGGEFRLVGTPDPSTGALTMRRTTAAGSTVEVTLDRRGKITNFRVVDDPSLDLQQRIDEGITRRNQRTQAQQAQQANLGQIVDPDLKAFTEDELRQLSIDPATINAELKANFNNAIGQMLRSANTFAEIEAGLESMGFLPGRFLYQDFLNGGHWVLRDKDGNIIGQYADDATGLRDLKNMSYGRIEIAFGTNNVIPYVLEQFVDGIQNRGYTNDITNITRDDYAKAVAKYLSYYDAVFGPEVETVVPSTERDILIRQRLQQRWQDIYDGRVLLTTLEDVLKFYGDYIQVGWRLFDKVGGTHVNSNHVAMEDTDSSAFLTDVRASTVQKSQDIGLVRAYMIGDRIYAQDQILKAAHQKNNLNTIQYDQMENLAQQELQKYTESPSVRARRGERRYIDRLNQFVRESVTPLLSMTNLDDIIEHYENLGGRVETYKTYYDLSAGTYIGKNGQKYSRVDINTSEAIRQLTRWEGTSKPTNANINEGEQGFILYRPDGMEIFSIEGLAIDNTVVDNFVETLKRADTMMSFLDTVEVNDQINDLLVQDAQEEETTVLTEQEAETQINGELFNQAQSAQNGFDFIELYRGQLQKRYVVRDLDSDLYKSRSVDSVDLSVDNFFHEDEVRNLALPTNYDIVGYWVLFHSGEQSVETFDTDENFDIFADRLRNQDMLDVINKTELIDQRVEDSRVAAGQQNARKETLRRQREAVVAQAQTTAQSASQPNVNPASAPNSIPYADYLTRMFGNEALVSLSNKVMFADGTQQGWIARDMLYEKRKKKGEFGNRNVNDPKQSLDTEIRGTFASKLWRSALRRKLVRTYKTNDEYFASHQTIADKILLQRARAEIANQRKAELTTVSGTDVEVLNYLSALTDEQKKTILAEAGLQGRYNKTEGVIELIEENIPNEMGVSVFFHELAVHGTAHLTKDLAVAWQRVAEFLRTQAQGKVVNGQRQVNEIGAAVRDIIRNRQIDFTSDKWGYWEEVSAYFVADNLNKLSFAQNIKALFRRWFRQTGIVAPGEDITVQDILYFAKSAAKIGISRANDWKSANFGKTMGDAFSLMGPIYHKSETIIAQQYEGIRQHYEQDRNLEMMGTTYDRATGLGQYSNLNDAHWLLVRTPFYKQWFGDWENNPSRASKVVDSNGEPLLVPHGRKHDRIAYDLPFTGFNGNFGYSGQYTYSQIEENPYLDRFSGTGIAQVFLNVRKPLHAHNYQHMSETMRRLGFQESTRRLDLRAMLPDVVNEDARAVMDGIMRYSEDGNPRGSFSDFLILNDDLLASVFPNADIRESHRFVTGLFEAATTPSGSILVEEPVLGVTSTEEYARSLGEAERAHMDRAATIFDQYLEGFENQMVRLSYNPDGYFTAFRETHDDISMSTRETITDVMGAIDQRAQEYGETDMVAFKDAVVQAYNEIQTLEESELSNDEAFLNLLNLALHKLRVEEVAVRLGVDLKTVPAYPTMPTRAMLKEGNIQLAERVRGEMLRQGFDGLWGTDDILLLHPDQAHDASEFTDLYADVSVNRTQGITTTPYEQSIMEAVDDNLVSDAERLGVSPVRLRSEYRSIYQAFAPSAPWIKSNLDEYNWILTRTSSFKENFGDWQNDATEDMWLDWRGEPVRTPQGFISTETIQTEEGYFSTIGPSAFQRMQGTQVYSQAIDEVALESLYGIGELTEEGTRIQEELVNLQKQDSDLLKRIAAIQAQIARVQVSVPDEEARRRQVSGEPVSVEPDENLVRERDALYERVDNIGRYIDELQSTITEDVTPERAEEIRTRLSEISAREQEIGERFINRTLVRRDVSLNELRSLSERYNRLRSRLEKLRNEYIEIEAVDNVIENIRLRISQLNDAIDASTARAKEIGTAQNRLNELNAQRNRAILEREKVLSKIFGLNERMLSVLTSELRAERERILSSPDTISTREGTIISPDEFRRLTDIEDLLAPMTSIVDEQRPYNEMMARLSKLRDERDYRNAQIERLNGEIETILDNESFEDEGERTLAALIRERDQRMREITEVEEQVYNEYGSRTGVSERVAFLENRIRTIEERLGQLGEKIDTLAERRLLENEEYAETVIQEQSEQEEEVRRLLQERRVLTAELNNYGIQSSITSLTRLKEELLGQISGLNENILSQMERQRRRMTAPTRRRMRNIERIIRKQGEIQTNNDEALSELNDVMDELNDVRERLRTSETRILNERFRAQLLLGAERMENEKWEFIDEMAGMMERVAIRIGEANRLVRDNPNMSQAALNAVNARKAGLVAELDRLRNQWTNGAAKMDDDIIVARDHAQRLAQRDPNIEQIINDLEIRRDTLVAQIDETNGELDYLDERLLNLSGVAGEVTIAMKDNLLEQLDRLNSEHENIQNRINELSERKSITQQAIEQRNATIAAMERVDAYVLAQQLEAAGHSAEQIKLVTGFERDKEGNWGYSLSNRDATFVDPIFIIEERLKELYKKAGLRMKPKNKASFNELRQLLDQYHRLYREKPRGLDIFKQNEMVELSELINRKVAGFINWITGREKDRITDALRKRGIMDNVEDIIYAPVKLSEMFNDEELFTAYPELNNTVVEIYMDKGSTTLGAKVTGENRFRFNVAHLRLHTDYMEAVVHEIQHQIQEWENWTPGARGDVSTAQTMREYLRNYGEFGARYAGRNWAMSQEQLRAYSQDKFLDDDNAYWNEWFERIFNESMTPIRSDEFIFSSTGQVQNVSNYDLGYFSTTAPVAKTNWKSPSELDNEEYITLYRAVVVRDGKYYSPMAEILAGNPRSIELGKWEYSVEHPELIVTEKGKEKFRLIKKDGGTVSADYAPYIHSSLSPLNDQFTTAYRRPIAVLEIRVPKSEVSSGYRAEKAKKSVGWSKWRSGPVASKLGNVREVMLSRYAKPVRALSDTQVAERIKEINPELFVKEEKAIPIPINVVTPGLLQELVRLGATVGEPSGFKTQYPAQAAEKKRLSELAADIRKNGVNSSYFGSVGQTEQFVAPPDEINLFSMTGSTYGRASNYNLDIYDREEIQGSGGAYKLKDGRIFIDPDEVGNDDVARVMLYALVRENPNVMANGSIAEAVAIIRDWENSTDNEWRSMYNRIRTRMDAVHAPDSAILAYAVRQFMSEGISALNPTSENSPQGVFAAILREIPGIMGQAAGVSTSQVSAMPSDVITVTNALSGINNDTIDIAVPSLNMDQRTFEALETKANAPAFMETVMQDVKGLLDEYDNTEFQFINGVPHIRMGDLVLNLGTDPIFARNIVDQLVQNTVDMGNHDLTDRQNPGEEENGPGSMFGDLAKRLPENAQLLGNARQEDVERFIKDNIPAYIADRIRVFYEETDESKAIFGEEYNGRFKPLMADREVIFIKAYGNRSLADVVGTTVKLVSMFGWTMWNNADFIPLMNELYTVLEHNIKTELPSYYAKIRGNTPTSSEKAALISAYLAAKSTSIYELTEFAGTSHVAMTQEQKLIELGEKLKNEIGKVSLHMAESFASDFSQNEELVKEYTEKLLRLTMAPFHGQGVWLAYDLDYDRVRQTNPDAALALQKWENLSRVTVFANDFGPTYMAEPVTDTAISNAEMLRKFRNASPFMQKVWRFYWRNWHPPQKGIGDTILGTENSVMLSRAFNAVTEDMGLSMRNIFANVKQFQEELLRIGIESEEFDGKKGYEQELRDRGVTNEKLLDKAMIVDSFLRFGRQRMLENVIEIRRLITANAQKVDDYMRREGVSEKKIQEMHAEMNAFANRFISDWEHRSYRAYTDQGQEDLTEMYRILDGTKGRSDFKSMIDGIKDEINRLEQKKTSGQIKERAYGRERKKLHHRLNIYERLDALYHWSNQSVMSRLPSRPTQAQAANVPVDTVAAMKKEIERVRTLVAAEKARGVGGRMDLIPSVRKRKLNENNPHDVLYMKFLDQVKDPAIAMLYNLDQQGKIMDKLIFNTRFGESIIKTGMGTMKGTPDTKGLKVNNLSWMENGTFLRYVQIDPFFLDEIANEMEIQDKLKEGILGNVINLIKQNMTVLNWRMSISNWIGNLSNLIATGQIFRFSNWTKAFGMNKDKLAKQFLTDFRKSVDSLSKKDVENAVDSATKEYNEAVAMYQHEMNKLNIWGSGLTTAQIDAYGQGGWEKVTDLLGMTLQSISEKTKSDFFDDVSAERMRRKVGDWMRYAREFYGFGDEWVKPLTYINNRAVAMAKYRAMHNWSRFEGHENSQEAVRLNEQITNQAIHEAALLTLKETTTWELSPDFARKITRSAARVVAPDFLLHQFQMLRIMTVNTQRWLECADEVGRLNAKGKANWTADEKVYYALVRGELVRRTVGQAMMGSIFAAMYTSAFSLSGYLVNLAAGALAGSGDDLEKKRRGQRKADDAPGMDWEEFRATSKLCNVASMISDLYSPVMWVPGKVGKEFIAYNDQRVNAAYTMAQVRPPSVNPTAMERLGNMAMTLVNMGGSPLTVQLVNLWHGKNSFGQNITRTEALWETLGLLTPQLFHQGYHIVQGMDRAMLGTEDIGWREKKKHRELSGFDIGGVKVKRISVDDMIENTGRKVKQLTSNENANRRVFLDKLQRNPDMSDREIKLAVNEILTSNRLEMDKLNYAMSAFRELGIDRKRLVTRLTTGRNTTSPILGINRANQLVEGRDVLTLILLTNLTERIKSIEGPSDPDTDFLPDERRKVLRNLITARRMIQEADK